MEWSDGASEGTDVKSTGESGTAKFLRVDGDGTCSWQTPPDTNTQVGGATGVDFNDDVKARFGTGNDLQIHHYNGVNYIDTANTTNLEFRAGSTYMASFKANTSVDLYHNNVKKFETTSSGINVTGAINVNGSPLSAAPTIDITASGSISDQAPVVVNSSGQATAISGVSAATGSEYDWETDTQNYIVQCKLEDNKYVIASLDKSNNDYATARVITVSGTTPTAHTPVSASTAEGKELAICRVSSTVFCLTYQVGSGSSLQQYAKLGTVSGNSISFGSATTIWGPCAATSGGGSNNAVGYQSDVGALFFAYAQDDTNGKPYSRAAHISGTSIVLSSNGSELMRNQNYAHNFTITENTTDDYLLVSWDSSNDGHVRARTVKLSGSTNHTTEYGTDHRVIASPSQGQGRSCYNPDLNRFVWAFNEKNNNVRRPSICYGTPTGSGTSRTISWTSPLEVTTTSSQDMSIAYSSASERYLLSTSKTSNGDGIWIVMKLNSAGTNLEIEGSEVTYTGTNTITANYYKPTTIEIGAGKFASTYPTGTTKGTTIIRVLSSSNLNARNFLGFASAAYTNGQTATINVVGNTTTQSSLTAGSKYYVQLDGTIGTTAADPSVEAGLALSSTKLLIK